MTRIRANHEERSRALLVTLPWNDLNSPSIQLGILKSIAEAHGFATRCVYLNLEFFVLARQRCELTVSDYFEIGWRMSQFGAGEWIFADAGSLADNVRMARYMHYLSAQGVDEGRCELVRRLRSLASDFIDLAALKIAAASPEVVGISVMHSQTTASLALASRIKRIAPGIRIVLGGANCEGEMGAALFSAYECLDAVVTGAGEQPFVALLRHWLEGAPAPAEPELLLRDGAPGKDAEATPDEPEQFLLSDRPPCYDDYFATLQRLKLNTLLKGAVWLPFEASRGCWWGEKHHCTFCGLNGRQMVFQPRPAETVLRDITALSVRYDEQTLAATDNILDPRLIDTLKHEGLDAYDLRMFFEVKSNISHDQLQRAAHVGITRIQPGIESLDTKHLALMRKGVRAYQNVRLLKWCRELGIDVLWNILFGLPDETPAMFRAMTRFAKGMHHLQPPRMSRLRLDRYSPYHVSPREHGIDLKGPLPFYELVFDPSRLALDRIAYFFDYALSVPTGIELEAERLAAEIETWNAAWAASPPVLVWKRFPGYSRIETRVSRECHDPSRVRRLGRVETLIFERLMDGQSLPKLHRQLSAENCRLTESELDDFVTLLCDEGFAIRDSEVVLALPTRETLALKPQPSAR